MGTDWYEKFSFILDPAQIDDQFATDSDGNLPRAIAHSQGSQEKYISKVCDSVSIKRRN
jgi:hypothetical protein